MFLNSCHFSLQLFTKRKMIMKINIIYNCMYRRCPLPIFVHCGKSQKKSSPEGAS
ncbi:hypothetical protein ACJYUA_001351 [Citrobacter freundii]|uniref:hypothetical protein n=1 Tax=unclassified Citrobacter TaxID=2644389 RepID=UPI000DE7FBCB|nr:hypothetical protein [Citrobacter freundii]NFV63183.1 hypothetical protein [Citrobacter freundii]QLD34970.1 hypothetical protein GOL70_03465 [Citrobacter freundii]RVR61457.1 hypothetical protein EOL25_12510 [Citrobacter freundii]TBV93026.1 hypothetical protein E0E99_15630 [Citrobacter freundii]